MNLYQFCNTSGPLASMYLKSIHFLQRILNAAIDYIFYISLDNSIKKSDLLNYCIFIANNYYLQPCENYDTAIGSFPHNDYICDPFLGLQGFLTQYQTCRYVIVLFFSFHYSTHPPKDSMDSKEERGEESGRKASSSSAGRHVQI